MPADPIDILSLVEQAYRSHYRAEPSRASVSFVGVEPIEVLRFQHKVENGESAVTHYLSLGMSRYPMADPSASIIEDSSAPRAELLISAHGTTTDLWRQLAVLAAAPAVEGAVYTRGTRVDLGQPLSAGSRCTGAVLSDGPLPSVELDGVADVQVLQLLPATANELAWARVHGSDRLTQRWAELGTDLADLLRDSVSLD
jgi:hypothetical protein